MLWQVVPQLSKKKLTLCKRISMYPHENKFGDTIWVRLKIKLWQILIKDHQGHILKIKLNMNELNQPEFTILHPEKEVYQTVKRGTKDIPICDVHSPKIKVEGEIEKFHTTKQLRQRLAGFAGMTFANEVIGVFIRCTPLGDN